MQSSSGSRLGHFTDAAVRARGGPFPGAPDYDPNSGVGEGTGPLPSKKTSPSATRLNATMARNGR